MPIKQSLIFSLLRKLKTFFYRTVYRKPIYIAKPVKRVTTQTLSYCDHPILFGYHDKTPFNSSGNKILAMAVSCDDTSAEAEGTEMEIGYFKFKGGEIVEDQFTSLSKTTTWCWQQGCMLQWHPVNSDREIIFNKMVDGKYGSVIFDVEQQKILKKYTEPLYAVSPNGKVAVTLNFARLGRLRPGYGYNFIPDNTCNDLVPDNDGLFLVDLSSGKKKLLVNLKDLADISGPQIFEHYINHATFSNDGSLITFFHLWSLPDGKKRNLIFYKYNLRTNELSIIEKDRTVSHYCWRNNFEIFATSCDKAGKWYYTLYNLKHNSKKDLQLPLYGDGHPMFSPKDKNLIVIDTYPDNRSDQHLCILNLESESIIELTALYSPLKYRGQVRCDLHPRWDREGRCIVVDSAESNMRKMKLITMDVETLKF